MKFQAAGHGPGEKLEEKRELLQQEQRKLQDQQEALTEKLAVIHSQINACIEKKERERLTDSTD